MDYSPDWHTQSDYSRCRAGLLGSSSAGALFWSARSVVTAQGRHRARRIDGFPVYEVTPRLAGSRPLNGHLLYLHGGAYLLDLIPALYWPVIARLANTLRRTVTVPIYPLAPEHTYRAVFPLLLRIYGRILDNHPSSSVVFAGDSAGGGMALALCHALRDCRPPSATRCPVAVALDGRGLLRSSRADGGTN
jgi:acetyl esterase/lipase